MIAFASLCPTIAILLVAGACLWRWLARVEKKYLRAALRITSMSLLAVPIGPIVWFQVARPFADGDYVCVACGRSARRLTCFRSTVWIGPARIERGVGATSGRYASSVGVGEHAHDWFPVGCRQIGFGKIGCTMIHRAAWFSRLQDIDDRELARASAARLRDASDRERHAFLYTSDWGTSPLESDAAKFDAWHEAWLRSHPDWP